MASISHSFRWRMRCLLCFLCSTAVGHLALTEGSIIFDGTGSLEISGNVECSGGEGCPAIGKVKIGSLVKGNKLEMCHGKKEGSVCKASVRAVLAKISSNFLLVSRNCIPVTWHRYDRSGFHQSTANSMTSKNGCQRKCQQRPTL